MKKFLPGLLALCLLGGATELKAQQEIEGTPYSYVQQLSDANIPTVRMPALDMDAIAQEDADDEQNGRLQRFSRLHFVDLNLDNAGEWTELGNGDRLWRLRIKADDALALNVGYSDFFMPAGATLFVYNGDRTEYIGAFTSLNNKDAKRFATGNVHGDETILEYFEPAAVRGTGIIDIEFVGHAYRFITPLEEELGLVDRAAQDCEVDIECPEGDDYWDERRGVCRIAVVSNQGQGWCSGSLVNNTAQDCKGYILTALHCGVPTSAQNFSQWIFYFNYDRPNCASGIAHSDAIVGCTRRADSNDNGGNSGSDFLLVELNESIPDEYDLYFNGWNNQNVASTQGVSIHHPSGCVKKISTYTNTLTTAGWGTSASHWRVTWSGTTSGHGVTEGGSSGSPIFNEIGLIVGTLTGGSSYCNSVQPGGQNQPDFYGKMSYHWTNNPNSAAQKLSEWLDPTGSGVEYLVGSFDPCGTFTGVEENLEDALIQVYPNPSEGMVNLNVRTDVSDMVIEVYNSVGELVKTIQPADHTNNVQVDLSDQANGLYYVTVYLTGQKITQKVSLLR